MPATLADIQAKYGESIYPLYKDEMYEPYMENKNGGYQGVVLYDELEDKVRCEECGKWFVWITPAHLRTHQIESSDDYKSKYELESNTPLCGKGHSEKMSKISLKNYGLGVIPKPPKPSQKTRLKQIETRKKNLSRVQHKNKYGFCDAQISVRLSIVGNIVDKKVSELHSGDLQHNDKSLYDALVRKYGNWEKIRQSLGLYDTGKKRNFYSDVVVISLLRKFVIKNKTIPSINTLSAKNGLMSSHTIYKLFGSWRRAKMMAGLDQLLAEVKAK